MESLENLITFSTAALSRCVQIDVKRPSLPATCHPSDVGCVCFFFISSPQGVVRDTAGYAVMLKWTMSNIYGLSPGDVRQ